MFTAYNEHQGQGGHPQMHPSLQQPPPQQQPQQPPQVPQEVLMKLLELQQQQVRPGKSHLGVCSMVHEHEPHIKKRVKVKYPKWPLKCYIAQLNCERLKI